MNRARSRGRGRRWAASQMLALAAGTSCVSAGAPEAMSRGPADAPAAAESAGAPTLMRDTEAALRRHIAGVVRGRLDFAALSPDLAQAARERPRQLVEAAQLGGVLKVEYIGPGFEPDTDAFEVTTERGFAEWHIGLAPTGTIDALSFRVKAKPPAALPTHAELTMQLNALLEQAVAQDDFAGVVIVGKEGEPLFEGAFGLADRKHGVPNRLDTKFRVGSLETVFTSVAVLQLIEAGKLSLDDTVGKLLPDYPNPIVAAEVTVEHLLRHEGGLGDVRGPEYSAYRRALVSLENYMLLYGKRAPAFEPGSRVEYSTYGYVLLGLMIASASGQSYYDYMREHVFLPAGMRDTDFPLESEDVPRRARGYTWGEDAALHGNERTLPARATSAGGGISTAPDLQRFARALVRGQLIGPDSMSLLMGGRTNPSGPHVPGASAISEQNGCRVLGQSELGQSELGQRGLGEWGLGEWGLGDPGAAPGMSAALGIFPDSGYVVSVLSNLDPPAAARIHEFIRVRLPGPRARQVAGMQPRCR